MTRVKLPCIFAALCAWYVWGAPALAGEVSITFRVTTETLPFPDEVFIAGNHQELGHWNAAGFPLTRDEEGTWTGTIGIAEGTQLEFKVTRGSWAREAMTAENNIPPNVLVVATGDTVVTTHVVKWKDEVIPAPGQVTGTLQNHRQMEGKGLLPRDVLVWLPPSYASSPTNRYPVLYMHDAQQVFDPATSTHGIDWQVDEWVTRLVKEGKMREIIVVATTSTSDRHEEYGFNDDKGKAYREFVVHELKPSIDNFYRTLPDRDHTAVMGSSMGGIASFLLAFYYPEVFSMAGCLSSAFQMDFDMVAKADWPTLPVMLYLDNGGVGLDRELQPGNDEMLAVLADKPFVFGENFIWFRDDEAEHNEEAWAKRVWMPLRFFFGTGPQDWIKELPPRPGF